jgi:hypothetical protein
MSVADSIAAVLAPHLGAHTADVVARHLCAKHGVDDSADTTRQDELREVLRRGLVVYVGADAAERLATECLERAFPGRTRG